MLHNAVVFKRDKTTKRRIRYTPEERGRLEGALYLTPTLAEAVGDRVVVSVEPTE